MQFPPEIKRLWNKLGNIVFPASVANETRLVAVQETVDDKLEHHIHTPQEVAPFGVTPAALVAGVGAYQWGGFVELLAAGVTTNVFDLHWAIINNPDTNGDYEIEFVYGAGDTHACYCGFRRSAATVEIVPVPLMTIRMPAGSRIRVRCRHSTGVGAPSVAVSRVFYHEYP